MNVKLGFLLVLFSVIALQQSSAAWRGGWRRPGPIGIMPHFVVRPQDKDDVRGIDENEDGFLNEAELAKHLNERDIAQLMEALDEDGDDLVSVDEFLNKK